MVFSRRFDCRIRGPEGGASPRWVRPRLNRKRVGSAAVRRRTGSADDVLGETLPLHVGPPGPLEQNWGANVCRPRTGPALAGRPRRRHDGRLGFGRVARIRASLQSSSRHRTASVVRAPGCVAWSRLEARSGTRVRSAAGDPRRCRSGRKRAAVQGAGWTWVESPSAPGIREANGLEHRTAAPTVIPPGPEFSPPRWRRWFLKCGRIQVTAGAGITGRRVVLAGSGVCRVADAASRRTIASMVPGVDLPPAGPGRAAGSGQLRGHRWEAPRTLLRRMAGGNRFAVRFAAAATDRGRDEQEEAAPGRGRARGGGKN